MKSYLCISLLLLLTAHKTFACPDEAALSDSIKQAFQALGSNPAYSLERVVELKRFLDTAHDCRLVGSEALAASCLGKYYYQGQIDSSIFYYRRSLRLRQSLKIPKEISIGCFNLAYAYLEKGHSEPSYIDSSITLTQRAIKLAEGINGQDIPFLLGIYYNLLGTAYFTINRYQEAILYHEKGLEYHQPNPRFEDYFDLSNDFWKVGELDKSMEYLDSAFQIRNEEDKDQEGKLFLQKGILFAEMFQPDSTPLYFDSAYQHYLLADTAYKAHSENKGLSKDGSYYQEKIALIFSNIGSLLEKKKEFPEAIEYYQKALEAANQSGQTILQLSSLISLADLHFEVGAYQASSTSLIQAAQLLENSFVQENNYALGLKKGQAKVALDVGIKGFGELVRLNQQKIAEKNRTFLVGSFILVLFLFVIIFMLLKQRKQQKEMQIKESQLKTLAHDYDEDMTKLALEVRKKVENLYVNKLISLGRDLHDLVNTKVDMAGTLLSKLEIDLGNKNATSELGTLEIVNDAVTESQDIIRDMSHELINGKQITFKIKLADFIEQIQETFDRLNKIDALAIHLTLVGIQEVSFSDVSLIHILAIIQGTTRNVIAHAKAKNLWVSLEKHNNNFFIKIKDDGKGFEYDEGMEPTSKGLKSIVSRVNEISGEINISSFPGKGTSVIVTIPLT